MAAEAYLADALDLIERNALFRSRVDWQVARHEALAQAATAASPADTYPAIRWALAQLGDQHSFLATPDRGSSAIAAGAHDPAMRLPEGQLRADGVAYLHVPAFHASPAAGTRYASTLQAIIADLDDQRPLGWMIDLSENTGGNMGPMLVGLGPLLGEGPLGAFQALGGRHIVWRYNDGKLWVGDFLLAQTRSGGYQLHAERAPVAVITGARTASSGEIVAVAFGGRPWTRRFGAATRGLTTANQGFDLSDGATICLTVGLCVDRAGRLYGGALAPDVAADAASAQDVAAAWIAAERAAAQRS